MSKKREFKKQRTNNPLKIIVVTGSIGMGKSTTASLLTLLGYPLFDADYFAKKITDSNYIVFKKIKEYFPSVVVNKKINRDKLGKIVFSNNHLRVKLESIIHPYINDERDKFFRFHKLKRSKAIVMDIPLLFELNQNTNYKNIVVVSAPHFVQRYRVNKRPGMTQKKFNNILETQVPDKFKRKHCSHIVLSGLGKRYVLNKLKKITNNLGS